MKLRGCVLMCAMLMGAAAPLAALESDPPSGEPLQIEGSTTVGPIVLSFAEAFRNMYPDEPMPTVRQTGSGDGAAALIDGRCHIASMSRFMKASEARKGFEKGIIPVAHAVALDGVCVVVHPSNPIKELSIADVNGIYTGRIANWNQLGGPDMEIVVISRDTSSGTYETFEQFVMTRKEGGEKVVDKMFDGVEYVNSNPQAYNRVRKTEGAIGYVGFGFLDEAVKALRIDGVQPTQKSISSGRYPLSRPLYLFTNGYPELGSRVYEFCIFHLSEQGQDIIEEKGFVPYTSY